MKLITNEKFDDLKVPGFLLARSGLCVTVCDARQEFNEEVASFLLSWLKKLATDYKAPFKVGEEIYEPLESSVRRIVSSHLICQRRYVRETLHHMLTMPFETPDELKERLSQAVTTDCSRTYGKMIYYFLEYDVKFWKSLRKDVHEFLLTTMINYTEFSKKKLGMLTLRC
jgi:hypothetical protein